MTTNENKRDARYKMHVKTFMYHESCIMHHFIVQIIENALPLLAFFVSISGLIT